MSLEATSRNHERDNARTAPENRSPAPTAPRNANAQPRGSVLTALPDMNPYRHGPCYHSPYHHGPSRTEPFSRTPLRGQRDSDRKEQQAPQNPNPLRFSQRFPPPGMSVFGDREYEQVIPFGSLSEPRPRAGLDRLGFEGGDVGNVGQQERQQRQQQQGQQHRQLIPPAAFHDRQYTQREAPPLNAPRGPANPYRHQYRHTLAPDFRAATPTPTPTHPLRSGNRGQGQLRHRHQHQHQQDVSRYQPTHGGVQTELVPADTHGRAVSHRSLPRHILGRPCPLNDRNCHIHHGIPCHEYWAHCPLARKTSMPSALCPLSSSALD
ncbi:hypothetical protein BDV97DRAFT_373684 [Delphinella strobiligena]|nr:hypothetical protein BDV97DRAFT_373684 [Delphinella strobiligena]